MMLGKMDYGSVVPPGGYCCSECGAHGVKLWREYQTIADAIELRCVDCALRDQGKDWMVGEDGRHKDEFNGSDQIGWLVPAVPTIEGDTYWGYSSVPSAGCVWWFLLPLRSGSPGPNAEMLAERLRADAWNSDTVREMDRKHIRRLEDRIAALERR